MTLYSRASARPDFVITLSLTPAQAEALHTFLFVASLSSRHLGPAAARQIEAELAPIAQHLTEQLPQLSRQPA